MAMLLDRLKSSGIIVLFTRRMNKSSYQTIRIIPNRLRDDLSDLAEQIVSEDEVNSCRTFSEDHLSIREWFKKKVIDSGLELRVDRVSNHSAFLSCGPSKAKTLLIGSHLDYDPLVGRYNENIGVVSVLEVLRVVKEKELQLPFHLEAICFTGPIGTQNIRLGSDALAGKLTPDSFDKIAKYDPEFLKGLALYDLDKKDILQAYQNSDRIVGFIGIFFDHNQFMDYDRKQIGVVSQIAGKRIQCVTFHGDTNYPASATMKNRSDASIGASAFTLSAHQLVEENFKDCTFNVGGMGFFPGERGRVPSRVDVYFEFRALDSVVLADMETALIELGKSEAAKYGLGYESESLASRHPVTMSAEFQKFIIEAVDSLGLTPRRIVSMVGFDGIAFSETYPVGIIIAPKKSRNDVSSTRIKDWEIASEVANVLFQLICNYAFNNWEINSHE